MAVFAEPGYCKEAVTSRRIDVQVTGASRLDVNLLFSGEWTAAFGGAEGLPVAH
jgi:hypothetical protein